MAVRARSRVARVQVALAVPSQRGCSRPSRQDSFTAVIGRSVAIGSELVLLHMFQDCIARTPEHAGGARFTHRPYTCASKSSKHMKTLCYVSVSQNCKSWWQPHESGFGCSRAHCALQRSCTDPLPGRFHVASGIRHPKQNRTQRDTPRRCISLLPEHSSAEPCAGVSPTRTFRGYARFCRHAHMRHLSMAAAG